MNRLKFEGKGFDYFKIFIVDAVLLVISLSLLYPRAIVRQTKYLMSQAFLGDSPFQFLGSTKVAFNAYMKTLLFFVILIFVSACEGLLIGYAGLQNTWVSGLMVFFTIWLAILIIDPLIFHGDLNFFVNNTAWRSVKASYKGKLSDMAGITIRGTILTSLTLGIYTAWYETQLYQYIAENTRFGSLRFRYDGTSKDLFKIYLKGFLLGVVTLGIYTIWNFRELYDYSVNHTVVRKGDQEFNLHSDANTREVFEMLVGNLLLVVLTLGFGLPWAIIRASRFMVNHCVVPSAFNLDSIEDKETEEAPEATSTHWLDKWNPKLLA